MGIRLGVLAAIFACALAGQSAPELSRATADLRARVQNLDSGLQTGGQSSNDLAAALAARADLLVQLIESDPSQVSSLALPARIVAQVQRVLPDAPLESAGEWRGTLEAEAVDDFAHGRGDILWYLREGDRRVHLHFTATVRHSAGTAVKVRGTALRGHVAVESIEAEAVRRDIVSSQCTSTGPQKVAVIALTTPSYPSLPAAYSSENLQEIFFGNSSNSSGTASLNGAWQEMSFGKTSATGQVFGPFALSQDVDCAQSSAIQTAAMNAAAGVVDFSQFSHLAFVFPVGACSTYAGRDSLGCWVVSTPGGGTVNSSVGWFPALPGGAPSLGVITHELGHSLGLGHSSADRYSGQTLGPIDSPGSPVEYGDPFAVMGISDSGTGNQWGQYAAPHKSVILNWLTPGDYSEVTSSGTFELRPYEAEANPRSLRILRDPLGSAWLWLEYRQRLGDIDPGLEQIWNNNVFDGVLVHYEDGSLNPTYTYLLDFTAPETPPLFTGAALVSGRSWSDPYSPLTITLSNASLNGVTVNVAYDPPCATLAYSATTFPNAGGSGTVTVTAPSSCSWTAWSGASWIHLTGSTAGQGNGAVTFTIDADVGANQRVGSLVVQRQSQRLIQSGSPVTVLSVAPSLGSGGSGSFTFLVADDNGYSNLGTFIVRFQGPKDCWVYANPYTGLALIDDSGLLTSSIPFGAAGQSVSNSVCTVRSTGSSFSGSGSQAQIVLQMSFAASFAGAHRVWGQAMLQTGGGSAIVPVGTWLVPSTIQPALTITANQAGAPFTVDGGAVYEAPATLYLTPGTQHTVKWLTSAPAGVDARYTFQSWSDGLTANPRTIVAPSSDTAYAANLAAQYLLQIGLSPAMAGTATANPPSSDGFYDSGTTVALSGAGAAGYSFAYFSGDVRAGMSQSVEMDGPRSVTANFSCALSFNDPLPYGAGPGPMTAILAWTLGSACPANPNSDSAWLTLGTAFDWNGITMLPVSIAENSGGSRTGSVTLAGGYASSVVQDAAGSSRPNVISVAPSGGGLSQIFAVQVYHAGGYAQITSVDVFVDGPDSQSCRIYVSLGQQTVVSLWPTDGYQTMSIPGSGTIRNDICLVSGAASSVSGSGKVLTLNLAITFQAAFAGPRTISASAADASSGQSTMPALFATWTVPADSSGTGKCDVTQDAYTTVPDVAALVREALGLDPSSHDLDRSGTVNLVDIQLVLNAARGQPCMAK